ncbi:hypothetical protein BX070DRAFT_233496 [Coemansia spiralis]|nr:hypothetical protein BX070DRAFT_233496 [Coemansia spiralis]
MSIFFGGIYKVSYFVGKRADLYVIDLDHGTVGSNITNIILNAAGVISPQPQWKLLSAMRSRRDAEEFIRHNGWGAIVINRGASSGGLQAAAQSSAYNPSRMLTVLLASGRNALVSNRYIEPQIDTMAQYTVTQYNVAQVNTLKKQQQNQNANIAPTDRLSLIGYTTLDTAPYGFGIAPVAPTYMLFVSLACTLAAQVLVKLSCNEMFSYVNHHQLTLYFHSLMLMWSTLLSTYGALAVLAFRGPGYTKNSLGLPLTCGRFFAILTSLDIALFVTSQWLFFWITILPPDFVPVFFIFTMVTTSASGIVALELVPKALRWIVVVPGYNNAELFRYIVSGAHPQLGLHIGILLGEMVLMFALNSVAIMCRVV